MLDFLTCERQANTLMAAGEFADANRQFAEGWNSYAAGRTAAAEDGNVGAFDQRHTPEWAFWLLLNGGNAAFMAGDYDGCWDVCVTCYDLFKDIGLIAGNPFFHLRAGQPSFEMSTREERADPRHPSADNLSRAMITGGIEMFNQEDAKYEAYVVGILKPPHGFENWRDTKMEGCSLNKLNLATGHILKQIVAKVGMAPPYEEP